MRRPVAGGRVRTWFLRLWLALIVLGNGYIIYVASYYPTIECALFGCFDIRGIFSLDILILEVILALPALVAVFWPVARAKPVQK
jgi:hypothetical protein